MNKNGATSLSFLSRARFVRSQNSNSFSPIIDETNDNQTTTSALIVVLELSSVQVSFWSQFCDFLLAHLFSGRFQRRSVQLANLLDSLLISVFLRDEENGNAKPGGDAQHRGKNGR